MVFIVTLFALDLIATVLVVWLYRRRWLDAKRRAEGLEIVASFWRRAAVEMVAQAEVHARVAITREHPWN